MTERPAIAPEGRQEPADAERPRADAGASDATRDQKRVAVGLARELLERHLARRVTDRVDEPAEPGRAAAAENKQRAVLQPDNGRRRHSPHPLGVRAGDEPRPHADHLGSANEIEFVGLPAAQRELSRKLNRIRSNSVVGRDSAQGPQPCVKRRRVAGRRSGLFHRQLLSRAAAQFGSCAHAISIRRARTNGPSLAPAPPALDKTRAKARLMPEQTYRSIEFTPNVAAPQRTSSVTYVGIRGHIIATH